MSHEDRIVKKMLKAIGSKVAADRQQRKEIKDIRKERVKLYQEKLLSYGPIKKSIFE